MWEEVEPFRWPENVNEKLWTTLGFIVSILTLGITFKLYYCFFFEHRQYVGAKEIIRYIDQNGLKLQQPALSPNIDKIFIISKGRFNLYLWNDRPNRWSLHHNFCDLMLYDVTHLKNCGTRYRKMSDYIYKKLKEA